jgi:uncharacterized protein YbjT (DUF2867 family)
VVAALTEEGPSGERYEVTGPRLMTFAEMAEVLSTTLGRRFSISRSHSRISTPTSRPLAVDFVADVFTQIARETLDGRNAYTADGVERALGRKPRDFAEFAETAMAAGAWSTAA